VTCRVGAAGSAPNRVSKRKFVRTIMQEYIDFFLSMLSGSGIVAGLIILFFWKADDLISKSGKEILEKYIGPTIFDLDRSEVRAILGGVLKNYFSGRLPFRRFVINVATLTLVSMIVVFAMYASSVQGFMSQLYTDPYALSVFAKQFVLDGFVVAFVVNYICFSVHGVVADKAQKLASDHGILLVAADVIAKISLFMLMTVISYAAFAYVSGSFGGNVGSAVDAAIPTIQMGLRFENLTSVYIYSVAISSMPIFLVALINILASHPTFARIVANAFFWLPFEGRPMRSVAVLLGIFVVVFYQISRLALEIVQSAAQLGGA
jgi:hypothetical protein